jgi:hypothetical protein
MIMSSPIADLLLSKLTNIHEQAQEEDKREQTLMLLGKKAILGQ